MEDTLLGRTGAFVRVIAATEFASELEIVRILSPADSARRVLNKALGNQKKKKIVRLRNVP